MAKYLLLLKINRDRFPADPKESMDLLNKAMDMTRNDLQSGKLKDWGMFAGEDRGYAISEQSIDEIEKVALKLAPYVTFEVHSVLSLQEMGQLFSSMTQSEMVGSRK